MKHLLLKKPLLKSCLFIAFCMTVFMSSAKAGLDYYEIFIGKKLILKRALNQPLNLETLPISQANSNEQLSIYYYQCNAPAKLASNRVITLKDADGNKIKEWKFADAKGSNTAMTIPVKELLQLQKSGKKSLALFYSAEGKTRDEKLVSVAGGAKTVGFLNIKTRDIDQYKMSTMFAYTKLYNGFEV